MVPLLHHLRRQPPIPLCIERSTCHYDGKYRMEGGSLCSHSFRNNQCLPCLNRLRPRFHSVLGVSVIRYILRNIHQTVTTDSQYIENYTVLNKNILIKTKLNSMLNVQSLTQRTFAQIVVFALLLLNSTLAFAQNQVNGIVTDKTGEPLIGVNVVEKVLPTVLSLTLTDSLH